MFFFYFCKLGELTKAFRANAAMFGITPDSVLKINSHAYTAVATSSTACGLGIVCDVWFLLRYNWVDLETFMVCALLILITYTLMSLLTVVPFS